MALVIGFGPSRFCGGGFGAALGGLGGAYCGAWGTWPPLVFGGTAGCIEIAEAGNPIGLN